MRKQMMLAAPFLAATVFVCQPAMSQETAADRAANEAGRALDSAGNEVNRAADAAGGAAQQAAGSAEAQVAGARQPSAAAMKNMSPDQKFAMKSADMNNFEIQAGQLAAEKAQSDEIKQLAQMTVADHTQAQQKLMQVMQKQNMQPSRELMPVHQAMLSELQQMDGKDFEKAYLYGQVAGHVKAVLMIRDATTEVQDPALKEYATMALPKVQQHLAHAQKIARADEAMTAGARIGGGASERESGGASRDRSIDTENTAGGRSERGAAPARGADAPGSDEATR